jgi:serine/threonine protein kinase
MSVSPHSLPETEVAKCPPVGAADASIEASRDHRDDALFTILAETLEAMAVDWHVGHRRPAEKWLADHPELAADSDTAVRIVYEEFCLREEHGERVESAEFYRRFPLWRDGIHVALDCHRLLRKTPEPEPALAAGQTVGELRLLREIGSGALGKVFLATQPALSDRLLAVKFTHRRGQEHLSLARLQHTHIVPLYSVQDFPEQDLRALCMPFVGGASWADILHSLDNRPVVDRSGQDIVDCLAAAPRHDSATTTTISPAIGFLARSTYVEAVCWIGACLADGLSYAHQRGLVHLDVKPSNVLLAADGQPMLLDFHLARESAQLRDRPFNRLGGTPGYMSPEQVAATEAIRQGSPVPRPVDERSDIFSLGVLLYESLAGQAPHEDVAESRRAIRAANPRVSRGLEDIVHKCLARTPSARYREASLFAGDLRRHLANLPLAGVANRSLIERWQKWRRRKPAALAVAVVAAAAILFVSWVVGLYYRDRVQSAEALLLESEREFNSRNYSISIRDAQAGIGDVRWFPWLSDLKSRLTVLLKSAERARAVSAVHDLVEQLRFLDEQNVSPQKLTEIAAGCRKIWEARDSLSAPAIAKSDDQVEKPLVEQLRLDLLDLAILSARLEIRIAASSGAAASGTHRRAAQILTEARQVCGPSPILDLEERDLKEAAEKTHRLQTQPPPAVSTAWEHYAVGRWLVRHEAWDEAEQQFEEALKLEPEHFWARYQTMRMDFQLKRFDESLHSADVCVALAPQQAECRFNRGLCRQALSDDRGALDDFDKALRLDPTLAAASLARGELMLRKDRLTDAEADFLSAIAHGCRPADGYFQMAQLSIARHDPAIARQWLRRTLAEDPDSTPALALERDLARQSR